MSRYSAPLVRLGKIRSAGVTPVAQRMSPVVGALVIEWLFVVAAALPLVWAVRCELLTSPQAAFALMLVWLNPGVIAAVRFPVHPTTWAVAPMISLGVGYLAKSRIEQQHHR